jgi:glucose-1-phosphate cytidylyltransferase
MQVVILAGGLGSRLSEETSKIPKPMVEIGGKPILWHIMKYYSTFGFNDFIICCGYKGYEIKEYFLNYCAHNYDMVVLNLSKIHYYRQEREKWNVTLLDTGQSTLTEGRILKIKPYVGVNQPFMVTYGDGLCDVDLNKLKAFHYQHQKVATVTAVKPLGRFGALTLKENVVSEFNEKISVEEDPWINGGFFIFNYSIFDYLKPEPMLEEHALVNLAKENNLMAYKHKGFWQCMDTIHDKELLEKLWKINNAPWKKW